MRSADGSRSVVIGIYACNVSNFIIPVNEGFVKSFIILADKLTEAVVNIGVVEARVCELK